MRKKYTVAPFRTASKMLEIPGYFSLPDFLTVVKMIKNAERSKCHDAGM